MSRNVSVPEPPSETPVIDSTVLAAALKSLADGTSNPADIKTLRQALQTGQIVIIRSNDSGVPAQNNATAANEHSVIVQGNADHATILTGNNNVLISLQGEHAQALLRELSRIDPTGRRKQVGIVVTALVIIVVVLSILRPSLTVSLPWFSIPIPAATATLTPAPGPTRCDGCSTPTGNPTPCPSGLGQLGFYCVLGSTGHDDDQACTDTIQIDPPRQASRIHIEMTRQGTGFGYSLWEVRAIGGTSNWALQGKASASSVETLSFTGCRGAQCAIDGDLITRWGSDWTNDRRPLQWLEITLPEPVLLDRLELVWQEAYAKDYCVTLQ